VLAGPKHCDLNLQKRGRARDGNEWFIHHLVGVLEVPEVLVRERGAGIDSLAGI
jgi:hypothetical protein